MLRWRVVPWLLAAVAGVTILSGCGGPAGGSHVAVSASPTSRAGMHQAGGRRSDGHGAVGRSRTGGPSDVASTQSCAAPFRAGLVHRRLPTTFDVAAVYECQVQTETILDRGVWEVVVERRATTGANRVAAALRRPNAPTPKGGVACPLNLVLLPGLVVVSTSGLVLEPTVPTDACGSPQLATLQALDHLTWKTLSTRLIAQTETQEELATGCAPAYKDLFALYANQLHPAKTSPVFAPAPPKLIVCVFRDGHGSNYQVGRFVGGAAIHGQVETAVLDGISHGRTSTGCASAHSDFAVLWRPSNPSITVAVELGGCDRVLRTRLSVDKARDAAIQSIEIGQASPASIQTIERIGRPS